MSTSTFVPVLTLVIEECVETGEQRVILQTTTEVSENGRSRTAKTQADTPLPKLDKVSQ